MLFISYLLTRGMHFIGLCYRRVFLGLCTLYVLPFRNFDAVALTMHGELYNIWRIANLTFDFPNAASS